MNISFFLLRICKWLLRFRALQTTSFVSSSSDINYIACSGSGCSVEVVTYNFSRNLLWLLCRIKNQMNFKTNTRCTGSRCRSSCVRLMIVVCVVIILLRGILVAVVVGVAVIVVAGVVVVVVIIVVLVVRVICSCCGRCSQNL